MKTKRRRKDLRKDYLNLTKEEESKGFYRIHGKNNAAIMKEEGLEFKNGPFISYKNIQSIKNKDIDPTNDIIAFGLVGLATSKSLKNVEIITTEGKLEIKNVKKKEANTFVNAIKTKI